jgi:cellulose synthase/poly-beta-1,6-N-acetylglucosamine synthase-like glycosyltransferase
VNDFLLMLLGASVAGVAYVYAGYPLLLALIVRLRGARVIRRADVTPSMTLVISAYNEAAVIRAKLENSLALDYPAGALDVVVISDASSDGTDEIVSEYADRGVRLVRQPERRGKTAGLNRSMPLLGSEILVFSDANAIYEPDALRKLARNFADAQVGAVTGEAQYLPGASSAADATERVYWNYEMRIKRLETAVGSMVGGDGAIYAIRKSLWRELPEDAINDFLNPLQIVAAGWRAVYEPEAICHEETAGATGSEYRRRVRIISRSWRAVFQAHGALNPFRVGLFAWALLSHKVLRWLLGPLVFFGTIAAVALVIRSGVLRVPMLLLAALLGVALVMVPAGKRLGEMLVYFAVINAASMVGVMKGSFGRVSGVWSTPRASAAGSHRDGAVPVRVGIICFVGCAVVAGALVAAVPQLTPRRSAELAFWASTAVLGYVYVAYPLTLSLIRRPVRRPVRRAEIEPSVCLFIAANDEGAVMETKLQNALALDYPADRLDIVVASDGSVDATNAIVTRFADRGVRLLATSPRRGKVTAIVNGIRSVTSDIVVFSDANTFLEPGALRALIRNFADQAVGAVSGDVVLEGERASLARSEDLYYQYERWIQQAESDLGSMVGADGALYAIRRELFVAPPADTILDDMAIPMAVVRAGRRVIFESAARAHEQGSSSAREEFSRKSRVIAGAVQFLTRSDSAVPLDNLQVILSLISHKILRWLSPVFATTAFVASITLAPSSSLYASAAVAQALLCLAGLAGCVPILRRVGMVSIAHYFCLVQAAAAVGFIRGITGRQSVLWRRFVRVPVG